MAFRRGRYGMVKGIQTQAFLFDLPLPDKS